MGKPKHEGEAVSMLKALSGQCHQVYTAHCMFYEGKVVKGLSTSNVYFKTVTENEILKYIATGEPLDKAGHMVFKGQPVSLLKK